MRRFLLCLLLLIAPSFASDHACCLRAKKLHAPVVRSVKVSFVPLQQLQPENLVHAMLQNSMPETECPHQAEVDRWFAWRRANPHARSRYAHGNDHEQINVIARLTYDVDDAEPEPDPSFGGCGCAPEVALAAGGCGWFMSQVYSLSRSK